MIWLIGLILFVVELYVLLHTAYCEWESTSYQRYRTFNHDTPLTIRVYQVIFLLLGNLWWCCAVTALIFIIVYTAKASKPSDESGNKGTIWKLDMDTFLTKEVSFKKEKQ